MAFIAIDLGSSFLKGAILDLEARSVRCVRRLPFPEPIEGLPPGRVEYDPRMIVAQIKRLLSSLLEPATRYEGLVMCSQLSCMVLTDSRGEARSNVIGWRDQRVLELHPRCHGSYYDVLQQILPSRYRCELGNELSPGCPVSFLFHDSDQGQIQPGMVPVSLPDYVLCCMTGCAPGVECTIATSYNLFDVAAGTWHRQVIEMLHLDGLCWPAVRPQGEVVGYLDGAAPIPCFTPVGDFQCAMAGALLDLDELSLNISTGSQVSRLTSGFFPGDYQSRPFFDGAYVNLYSHLPAGRALNVLIQLLTELAMERALSSDDLWSYIEKATAGTETDLDVSLCFYPGPAGVEGFIRNIRENNLTIGSLFRAAFRDMAQTYRRLAERLWPEQSWSRIVFSGGLAHKSETLRDSILREFGTAYRMSPSSEDTMLGLLVLARAFSGRAPGVMREIKHVRTVENGIVCRES